MGISEDINWAVSTLSESDCPIAKKVRDRLAIHVSSTARPVASTGALKDHFDIWPQFQLAFEDEETDLLLYAAQLEKVVEGLHDGPIQTPVKKRIKIDESIIDHINNSDTLETPSDEIQFVVPARVPVQKETVSAETEDETIEELRTSLRARYSQQKVVKLRETCKKEKLDTKGKKIDLVDRLVNKRITAEYGSPRMRNSYQTAMNSPLPISQQSDKQPKSLRSNTSSSTSLASMTSNTSSKAKIAKPSFKYSKFEKTGSKTRLRSPSPNSGPSSLPRTPRQTKSNIYQSFKSRMKEIQSGSLPSPRPWSKTPSKTNLMERCKTPSKLEIEEREAERDRKMKERKLQKEQEAQRKREEKAAHAEEIRKKKQLMDEEKKQKGKEKVFSLKKPKTKNTKLKDMRNQLAEKMRLENQREDERKMAEEIERAKREEQKRQVELDRIRAAEAAQQQTPIKNNVTQSINAGYEMTPQGDDKWALNPSSADNYNIEDLESGDETDDDERPRKRVPAWANMRGSAFKSAILRQYKERINHAEIFETINPNRDVNLEALFEHLASLNAVRRYRKPRNSSAQWTTMMQPRPLIDRTLNLDQSVYQIPE